MKKSLLGSFLLFLALFAQAQDARDAAGAAAGVEQKARAGTAKARQHGVHLLGIVALCCHWYHPLL
jgi:hypothetical protein